MKLVLMLGRASSIVLLLLALIAIILVELPVI